MNNIVTAQQVRISDYIFYFSNQTFVCVRREVCVETRREHGQS